MVVLTNREIDLPARRITVDTVNGLANVLPFVGIKWPSTVVNRSTGLQTARKFVQCFVLLVSTLAGKPSLLTHFNVGELTWKSPREFPSVVYNQSGFDRG